MSVVLITPPEPLLTVADARRHLRIDALDDDATLAALVDAATSHLDGPNGILGRAIGQQTWELRLTEFPSGDIELPFGPAVSVTSIKYDDEDDVEQTVAAEDYTLDTDCIDAPVITPVDAWPTSSAVRVRFVAGYAAVPAAVMQAARLLVGGWYEFREGIVAGSAPAELPMGVYPLASPFRRVTV